MNETKLTPASWGPIRLPESGWTLYGRSGPRRSYRLVVEPSSSSTLRDVFATMVSYSRNLGGRTSVCWDFLPGLHLYLRSTWQESHGIEALLDDWRRIELSINAWIDCWGPRNAGVGVQVFLTHGAALVTRVSEPSLHGDIALEIVRQYEKH